MQPRHVASLALLAALVLPGPAVAQAPLTLEVRGGALAPVGGFRDGPERGGTLGGAPSFGVHFALERSGGRHLILGFSQHRVDCSDDGCGSDGVYVSTAWDVGLRWDLGSGATVPWVIGTLAFPRVQRDRPEPLPGDVSRMGVGGELGAGIRISVGGRFHVSPGVRFGAVNPELPSGGALRMRYLVADVGVVISF